MAKGFGTPINKILGYVLLLYPSLKVYAADRSFDNQDEPFIGVTNLLSSAHIWPSIKQAKNSVYDYMSFLMDWMEEEKSTEITVLLCSLEKDKQGKLIIKSVNQMCLEKMKREED